MNLIDWMVRTQVVFLKPKLIRTNSEVEKKLGSFAAVACYYIASLIMKCALNKVV